MTNQQSPVNTTESLSDKERASADLLAALELALRYLGHPEVRSIPFALPVDAVIEQARAAIAKARGQDNS